MFDMNGEKTNTPFCKKYSEELDEFISSFKR